MTIAEIQLAIESIEKDALLFEYEAIDKRIDTIDFLEFHILGQLDALLHNSGGEEILLLKHQAETVKNKLEEINNACYKHIRENIRKGISASAFKKLVNQYFPTINHNEYETAGYDNLDVFINGLFPVQTIPEQTKELEAGMIFYQKTPARIVMELVEKACFKPQDVFFDLGCGLGQVVILVHLLSGIIAKGIEYEPAFCDYAAHTAKILNISNVAFINTDARYADYAEGTVFFMFTPFTGEILQDVLALLQKESLLREITIFTYGPCTPQVALQKWLYAAASGYEDDKLHLFKSY